MRCTSCCTDGAGCGARLPARGFCPHNAGRRPRASQTSHALRKLGHDCLDARDIGLSEAAAPTMCSAMKALPDALHSVLLKSCIRADDSNLFRQRLCRQRPVERIAVIAVRHFNQRLRMMYLNGQNLALLLACLLSPVLGYAAGIIPCHSTVGEPLNHPSS